VENPIRVLLVEDNPLDVQLLRWMLLQDTHQTFELETADTLSAGIQKIQQGGVDLLLLDLSLPDAHGFDTFHRAVEAVPDLPIIMLTGLDDENLALNAMKAGAQDYLVKGAVDSRGLRKAIRYAVERKRLQEQIVAYSEELSLKNEQLASDLKIAREIQQAFLPQHYPSFPLSAAPLFPHRRSRRRFFQHSGTFRFQGRSDHLRCDGPWSERCPRHRHDAGTGGGATPSGWRARTVSQPSEP
jgi:DNA-binding response OmpR family regulator